MSVHREAFKEFAENVSEELGDSLKKLVLYGSVARDQANSESDIDVFVVVENASQIEKVESLAFDVSAEYGVFIVPIVKTEDEFRSKKGSVFVREVERTGEAYV